MTRRILIVDDEPDLVTLLRLLLRTRGYEITSAENGQEALAVVAADPPDLVVLDAMMPVLDGYEACKRLKAEPATRNIPVLMLSARTLEDERKKGMEAGADSYLTKPFEPEDVFRKVEQLLSSRRP